LRLTVKLGGSILEDVSIRTSLLEQVAKLQACGHEIILVHGGGKSLTRRLAQMGLESRFVEGLRVTDAPTMRVALMVLAGEVNKMLVAEMGRTGCKAVGICGADASAIRCEALSSLQSGPPGLGFVGKPVKLDRFFFDLLLGSGLIPIVSSIAVGPDSQVYNINADQMASICAWGTGCRVLVYLTDVAGVKDGTEAFRREIGTYEIEELRKAGTISGGMLPKTESCMEALGRGVDSVYILPGALPDVLDLLLSGRLKEGTRIYEGD
jgi:acetylglutamate kinase